VGMLLCAASAQTADDVASRVFGSGTVTAFRVAESVGELFF